MLRQAWTLFRKDVAVELRSKDTLPLIVVFSVITLVVFNFAFDLRTDSTALLAPGILWVSFFFAGILGLGRSFAREVEKGPLEGLRAAPVDPGALYLAKFAANVLFVLVLQAVVTPLVVVFFNAPVLQMPLLAILPLGAIGFAAVGTPFAAMAANTRAREALLPILLLPVIMPVVIATVRATALAIDGAPWSDLMSWINVLLVFDVVFTVVAFLSFHLVVEE